MMGDYKSFTQSELEELRRRAIHFRNVSEDRVLSSRYEDIARAVDRLDATIARNENGSLPPNDNMDTEGLPG